MHITLNPYLLFNGDCRAAMEFYQSILGGTLTMSTYGESGQSQDPQFADKIIHALLENDRMTMMASDNGPGTKITFGDNVNLSLVGQDADFLRNAFAKLSEGGTVKMPLEKQFWGDEYGMLEDKFGFCWMVNIGAQK